MAYEIGPMTRPAAGQIARWTYEGEYAIYSFQPCQETLDELMSGAYVACTAPEDGLTGYFCFGQAARIPTVKPDVYPDGPVDLGLGLRPDRCGRGEGAAFLQAGLLYARRAYGPREMRLTVACFNRRAIALYTHAGFRPQRTVTHRLSNRPFLIMTRPADP